jgi:hypothetical protein
MIDCEQWFRKFRFLYTGTVVIGVASFSIAAFEIHGQVRPDGPEPSCSAPYEKIGGQIEEFDPWAISEF